MSVRTILSQSRQTRVGCFNPVERNARPLSIEIEAALQRMGNHRPLFVTIAVRFFDKSRLLIDELRTFLEMGELFNAAEVLHQLKGLAGTVGNMPLAETASRLETELKRTSPMTDSGTDLAQLESLLAAGNIELERVLAGFKIVPTAFESAHELHPTAHRMHIRNLIALLAERNLGALDVYHELGPVLKATLPVERHTVLVAAIDSLDFGTAAAVLDAADLNLCP